VRTVLGGAGQAQQEGREEGGVWPGIQVSRTSTVAMETIRLSII
jgi:hypothetical protein